jgi:hypothetical protein
MCPPSSLPTPDVSRLTAEAVLRLDACNIRATSQELDTLGRALARLEPAVREARAWRDASTSFAQALGRHEHG